MSSPAEAAAVAGRPRERADAARNRARVLAAADEVFLAAGGAVGVTMEDIARAAGVGRATLYRRYPDVTSIAQALLDEHEAGITERILGGPPPLGPGAAPEERLAAFYRAMIALLERHLHLVLGAERGGARLRAGAYGFWRRHVESLVDDAPAAVVDALMAPLAPEVYRYQRQVLGLAADDVVAGLDWLTRRVYAGRVLT
ncbi:TetR/AcrR family transcriptional regulator [Saccharothrix yanglingensis]|uniref:TetR family transcriptional regulator n=1 Tax=Saccharothrix yanglingensis TaxID=659496 RepID=A0ABU0X7W4_9PSEU|nr:helix-turn-helix domain-containing protein [Saccharothrix yanglingensis]MDQ2588132.1 TetR family transcriptional regulator [Saccharothrix yanglingensis]